jgi:hypothetical protein
MAYPNHERLIMAGALIRQIASAVFSFTTSEFQSPIMDHLSTPLANQTVLVGKLDRVLK